LNELLRAVGDYVVEKDKALITLAFRKRHRERVGRKGRLEDMGSFEL